MRYAFKLISPLRKQFAARFTCSKAPDLRRLWSNRPELHRFPWALYSTDVFYSWIGDLFSESNEARNYNKSASLVAQPSGTHICEENSKILSKRDLFNTCQIHGNFITDGQSWMSCGNRLLKVKHFDRQLKRCVLFADGFKLINALFSHMTTTSMLHHDCIVLYDLD